MVRRGQDQLALYRARQADPERLCRELNGRMRDELLNETLFASIAHAREKIAAWVDDYNVERPHSSLGYATPAAFAAELEKQWPARVQAIASPALTRDNHDRTLVLAG